MVFDLGPDLIKTKAFECKGLNAVSLLAASPRLTV